jgi:hypothetical protein
MSSWDTVTMENRESPAYTVMDRRRTNRSKKQEKADILARFRQQGFVPEKEKIEKAVIRIQKHFRGMIVRNPTGVPLLDYWSKRSHEEALMDEADYVGEEQYRIGSDDICHPVGWNSKNHYSEMGWMWCGQSCPCCRARAGDTLGACEICLGTNISF